LTTAVLADLPVRHFWVLSHQFHVDVVLFRFTKTKGFVYAWSLVQNRMYDGSCSQGKGQGEGHGVGYAEVDRGVILILFQV